MSTPDVKDDLKRSADSPEGAGRAVLGTRAAAGGSRELLALALPLVVSQSFMTVQVFVDTTLLSWHNPLEMAASLPAVMWFWLGFGTLQVAAGYVSTFVAQYMGAGRPHRVGPAVWQGIYFALISGLLFLLIVPAAPYLIAMGGHSAELQRLETTYLRCLGFAGLPMLILAAINGFFSGRGQTWTVLGIEAVGTSVNIALAMLFIFGRWGAPELGIAGAGWATVVGSWASALTALALVLKRRYAHEFNTRGGWRFESDLFRRLIKYGLPAGAQVFSDVLVFHLFVQLLGRLGENEAGATSLTIRLNMLAFLPMQGIAQAISILVGQRLGGDRPDLAERSTFTGMRWAFGYMCLVAAIYVLFPHQLVALFEGDRDPVSFAKVADLVPPLLACAAVYSLADAVNLSIAFALRGAGDTRFVSILTFLLAWPLMVLPTYRLVQVRGNLLYGWVFATAYILAMALCFTWRFRTGKWKTMRVIESAPELIGPASAI